MIYPTVEIINKSLVITLLRDGAPHKHVFENETVNVYSDVYDPNIDINYGNEVREPNGDLSIKYNFQQFNPLPDKNGYTWWIEVNTPEREVLGLEALYVIPLRPQEGPIVDEYLYHAFKGDTVHPSIYTM
jgi:hypothetical protein